MILLLLAGCDRMVDGCPNPAHPSVNYYDNCELAYLCSKPGWEGDIRAQWPECGCGCIKPSFGEWWIEERRRRINEEWND